MIKYRGGKRKELPEIRRFVPSAYDRYVEPFFGGGALYFDLEPRRALVNDLNKSVMLFYRGIRDNYDVVSSELDHLAAEYADNRAAFEARKAKAPNERVVDANEDLYYRIRDMFNGKCAADYADATLYYFINKTAYSGMVRYNKAGEYNVPYGRYRHVSSKGVTRDHRDLLGNADLMTGDYSAVFELCKPGDFVFLDPPYDCVFSDYGNPELADDGFNEAEHRRLAEAFYALPCKALMVIGKTDLTDSLYRANIVHEYDKSYAVNIRNRFKSQGTHILVANYRM